MMTELFGELLLLLSLWVGVALLPSPEVEVGFFWDVLAMVEGTEFA